MGSPPTSEHPRNEGGPTARPERGSCRGLCACDGSNGQRGRADASRLAACSAPASWLTPPHPATLYTIARTIWCRAAPAMARDRTRPRVLALEEPDPGRENPRHQEEAAGGHECDDRVRPGCRRIEDGQEETGGHKDGCQRHAVAGEPKPRSSEPRLVDVAQDDQRQHEEYAGVGVPARHRSWRTGLSS